MYKSKSDRGKVVIFDIELYYMVKNYMEEKGYEIIVAWSGVGRMGNGGEYDRSIKKYFLYWKNSYKRIYYIREREK